MRGGSESEEARCVGDHQQRNYGVGEDCQPQTDVAGESADEENGFYHEYETALRKPDQCAWPVVMTDCHWGALAGGSRWVGNESLNTVNP